MRAVRVALRNPWQKGNVGDTKWHFLGIVNSQLRCKIDHLVGFLGDGTVFENLPVESHGNEYPGQETDMGIVRIIAFILAVLLSTGLAFSQENGDGFKPGTEPGGFRGIQWETEFSAVEKEMEFYKPEPGIKGMKTYLRKGDDLNIGEAKIERIEYAFWKGIFFGVTVSTIGHSNWVRLRDAIFEEYGPGLKRNGSNNNDEYTWSGETAMMNLLYLDNLEEGQLRILSRDVALLIKVYVKIKG